METEPGDQKLVGLLSKLKDANGAYPSDILAARRQNYLKQVANIGLGIGVGEGLKNAGQNSNSAGVAATTVTSKIVETVLVAAIAIEAVAATYLYRDKIADWIRTYTGTSNDQVTVVASPKPELLDATQTPSGTPSSTPSVTLLATLSPVVTVDNNNANLSVNSTPTPDENKGNQYGLTPKPERTKEGNDTNNVKDKDK